MKKTTTYVRVVRKPQSSGAQLTKKPRAEAEASSRARERKKEKSELDEALKFGNMEGIYDVMPPMTLKK